MTKVFDANDLSLEKFRGAWLGLAVCDALGTTLEFKSPGTFEPIHTIVGGGPFGLKPGQWTDDTSMAICLAESLVERNGFDAADQMQRYVRWYREGHRSSTGVCFDIGNTTLNALRQFEVEGNPFSGDAHELSAGNGSIMRLCPIPMFYALRLDQLQERAVDSSRTTHGNAFAIDACRLLSNITVGALRGLAKHSLLAPEFDITNGRMPVGTLASKIESIRAGSYKRKQPPEIKGAGFVVKSLEAALWAFHTTDSFESGALAAVNLGDDADTTGAVYGQLAGAFYGEDAIPTEGRQLVEQAGFPTDLANQLFEKATATPI